MQEGHESAPEIGSRKHPQGPEVDWVAACVGQPQPPDSLIQVGKVPRNR